MKGVTAGVHLDNLQKNIIFIRGHLSRGTRLCLVVKANAYGHGAESTGRAAIAAGVDLLAVSSVEEGRQLREAGLASEVLLLGPTVPDQGAEVVRWRLTAICADFATARAIGSANHRAAPMPVHLEVDAGMRRSGCDPSEVMGIAQSIGRIDRIRLEGFCTHFSASDAEDLAPAQRQLSILLNGARELRRSYPDLILHAANSAAVAAIPASHLDLVRVGLSAYGYDPSFAASFQGSLSPVMELSAPVTALRRVHAGDHVSYGLKYRLATDTVIATIAAGYGDGYPWPGGRGGAVPEVVIRGDRYRLAGLVCMDHCMVDVGDKPKVQIGDQATLFGPNGPTAADVADWAETIPYEVLARISPRVKRCYC